MNEQLSLLDLLIEKYHKSVSIPIQHQHSFHTLKIKYNLVFYENLTKKLKNRPKKFLFSSQN